MNTASTHPSAHLPSCRAFWAWAVVGALLVLCLSSLFFVTGPVALVIAYLLLRRQARIADAFGALTGAGLTCVLFAALNWGNAGGNDHRVWLAAGVMLGAAGVAGFSRSGPHSP